MICLNAKRLKMFSVTAILAVEPSPFEVCILQGRPGFCRVML